MPQDIGYRFQPGAQTTYDPGGNGQGGPRGLSPQAAVKLLSLRVPERPAQGQIAPQSLLQGQGGQGVPGGGGLQAIIRALMALRGGQGLPGVAGGVPSPRIIPGIQDPTAPPGVVPQNLNLPPNLDEILARFRQMVPGGGFSGGLPQNQLPQQQGPAPPLF